MVTGEELIETLGQLVSCVGCRYVKLILILSPSLIVYLGVCVNYFFSGIDSNLWSIFYLPGILVNDTYGAVNEMANAILFKFKNEIENFKI
jgi:hypothetical protein